MTTNPSNFNHQEYSAPFQQVCDLLREWDPIGVADSSPDEYDACASDVMSMLDGGCTVRRLTRHLYRIRTKQMGLGGDWLFKSREREIAKKLVLLWNQREGNSVRPSD